MSPLCANRCAYRGAILELLCYSMLAGQQPPRVAWVCVQLARSRRVECGRTAAVGCSRFGLAEMQRVARWGGGGAARMALEPGAAGLWGASVRCPTSES